MRAAALLVLTACASGLLLSGCASRRVASVPPGAPTQDRASAVSPGGAMAEVGRTPGGGWAPSQDPASLQALAGDFARSAGERVFFAVDRYDLSPEAEATLDAQAEWLRRNPNLPVVIAGHADERGTREYNFALGSRRAQAVRDYLVRSGVAGERLGATSYGKERPLDPGSDEGAWSRNRNARTTITGSEDPLR